MASSMARLCHPIESFVVTPTHSPANTTVLCQPLPALTFFNIANASSIRVVFESHHDIANFLALARSPIKVRSVFIVNFCTFENGGEMLESLRRKLHRRDG